MAGPLVTIDDVSCRFGKRIALQGISAQIAPGSVTGLVGPDGAGKTTLIRLIAGLLRPRSGRITVCGFDSVGQAEAIHGVVGYMPQRFGLYEDLTVAENLALHADLRAVTGPERAQVFERLLGFTGLAPFTKRLAGALSGGMKQKLGLACTLIRPPRLLLLDEPSVGVDPLSRRELWRMVHELVDQGIGVLWSTAYLDEAERCGSVLLLNDGKLLNSGDPREMTDRISGRTFVIRGLDAAGKRLVLDRARQQSGVIDALIQGRNIRLVMAEGAAAPTAEELEAGAEAAVEPVRPRFEDAFVSLLRGQGLTSNTGALPQGRTAEMPPGDPDAVVEARDLTRRFGSFTAVDRISFAVRRAEIFGLLGPNGAGKSTTFKMLCGLLPITSGTARLTGLSLAEAPALARARLGYMSQKFSLYPDLSVQQNLEFFAGAYGLGGRTRREAVGRMKEGFGLEPFAASNAGELPLGFKQRLALACAIMHGPAILFLDEPTSGVDPLTRREFWSHINAMAGQGVTVLVTTHFMDEAEYCDRVGIVYGGVMIATASPDDLKEQARTSDLPDPSLEDAFIRLIERHDRDRKAAA
ncbi:MAG TPA: ATP-binding cassette domain-containing protein [Skermanella sp.]|jgi:ABC-2 type transport system ATP-binding protein|nr:ATP-binding cassette domain-containing protein [Skermanella sp.]